MRTNQRAALIMAFMIALVAPSAIAADKKESKISLKDCPPAVQKTLTREAFGAKIEEVEKEEHDGKTTYEADVKIDGKSYELKVGADGTLISKSIDDDDENDEKDDDKD